MVKHAHRKHYVNNTSKNKVEKCFFQILIINKSNGHHVWSVSADVLLRVQLTFGFIGLITMFSQSLAV